MSHTSEPTYGERLLQQLIQQLPKDEFYGYAEPRIDSTTVKSRYPDFVLIWRDRGIICIEVKDWKAIKDGDGRDVTIETNGEVKKLTNPYETARQYAYQLMERLEQRRELLAKHRGNEKLAFPVEPVVALTHQERTFVSWLEELGVFPACGVITADDLVSAQELQNALRRTSWTFALKRPMSEVQIEAIEHTLRVVEVRTTPEEGAPCGVKRGSLIQEQDDIIWAPVPFRDNGISTMLVRGVAGSGKTIVLTKKAALLGELRHDLRLLVTTFNKDMARDLEARIQQPRVQVRLFFDLVERILGDNYPQAVEYRQHWDPRPNKAWCKSNRELFDLPVDFVSQEISRRKDLSLINDDQYRADLCDREADLSPEEIDELCVAFEFYREYQEQLKAEGSVWQDYEDTVQMAKHQIHGHKYHRYFDIIMIDEGQDFSPNMYHLLRSMLKPGGFLFVCDDPMQSLWREFDLKDKGLTNAAVKLLKMPLRTTRAIADAAQSLFELVPEVRTADSDAIYPARTDHLEPGEKPNLTRYSDLEAQQQALVTEIQQQLDSGEAADSIAVITPNYNYALRDALKPLGVYYGHFNLVKGLEFETVYIADLDMRYLRRWNQRLITRRWLYRKLFVAMTRARSRLHLSYVEALPECLQPLAYYCETDD